MTQVPWKNREGHNKAMKIKLICKSEILAFPRTLHRLHVFNKETEKLYVCMNTISVHCNYVSRSWD